MEIIKQIDELQAKLNIQQYKDSQVDLNQIDSKSFDINAFLRGNFCVSGSNSELDMARVSETIGHVLELQRETCEQIAISVDMNLDKYVSISTKFDDMKDYFSTTDRLYKQIAAEMTISRDACTKKIDTVQDTLENYQYICTLQENLDVLDKLLKKLQQIEGHLESIRKSTSFQGFKMLDAVRQLSQCRALYKSRVETALQTRELAQKYRLVATINELSQAISVEADKELRKLLARFMEKKAALFEEDFTAKRTLCVLVSVLFQLQNKSMCENAVVDIVIKRFFAPVFRGVVDAKRSSTAIFATKQEFLEKQQQAAAAAAASSSSSNSKVLPIQILEGNLEQFIETVYKPLLKATQSAYQNDVNGKKVAAEGQLELDYVADGLELVRLLADTICEMFKADEIAFIFSVGSSEIFFQNYTRFQSMLAAIRELAGATVQPFECEVRIEERWNTKTYFYMRQSEIVKEFEAKLSAIVGSQTPIVVTKDSIYKLLTESIQRCFDDKTVFLPKVAVLFLKLSLQIATRFSAQIKTFTMSHNDVFGKGPMNEIVIDELCRLESHLPDYYKTIVSEKFPSQLKEMFTVIVLDLKKILRVAATGFLESKVYQNKTRALNNN